ncbi:hypothetical protein V6N13_061812 [Hibiscus sabdariffa]
MLSLIQQQLGGQPLNIVSGAADEILAVLKSEGIKNPDKKEIEKLLNPIPSQEDEDDDGVDNGSALQMGGGIDDDDMHEANEGMNLNVQDIDAYWLQRKISQAYDQQIDPQQCQKLAEEVLKILAEGDDREVETKLLVHLQFDKFSLIKYLLQNRLKVVWCTRLARAEGQEERKKIEEEMMSLGQDLAAILEQLHATRATAKERQKNLEKSIREEARRLKDESGGDGDRERTGLADRDADGGWLKGQRQLLDLDSLAFEQGGLLMANKKCDLPVGSYRHHSKGLGSTGFKGMQQLNRVQSRVYETALFSADNILLCAPTGAGKTNVAVLTILQQLALNMDSDEAYGVTVRELSGDQTLTRQQIEETQIIVTTPEKWDIITRKSGDRTYTQLVELLIIDEIHLLRDNRGPVLESIVARTVRQIETSKEHIRYRPVPLSQQYIGITVKKPLQRFQLMNDICYEKVMAVAGKHQVLIFVHSRKETAKTARAVRDTALANDTLSRFLKEDAASREILQSHTDMVKSNDLKDLLPYGFAIRHAGLARTDRQIVEELFADGHIQVLVSTATLAWGVNLPAHTVIIKGTQIYSPEKGAWTELSPLDVMQMLGCAGRPQYDSYGEGIIITGHSELQYYLSLMNQQLPIESQFVSKLADQLNAEIILGTVQNAREACNWIGYTSQFVSKLADQLNAEIILGTVQNAREACNWIGYTYLYIRMLRNSTLYGLPADVLSRDLTLEERRADLLSWTRIIW